MFPLTFQTEHVADMSEDTTSLVANFVARNMDRVPSTDYVRQHTYCVMLYTGDSLCLSALVLAPVSAFMSRHQHRHIFSGAYA